MSCLAPFKRGISYECRTPFLSMKVIKTAVDSDVEYDGADFNSVCCKYSQSLGPFFYPIWIRVSIINALYSAHVKYDD